MCVSFEIGPAYWSAKRHVENERDRMRDGAISATVRMAAALGQPEGVSVDTLEAIIIGARDKMFVDIERRMSALQEELLNPLVCEHNRGVLRLLKFVVPYMDGATLSALANVWGAMTRLMVIAEVAERLALEFGAADEDAPTKHGKATETIRAYISNVAHQNKKTLCGLSDYSAPEGEVWVVSYNTIISAYKVWYQEQRHFGGTIFRVPKARGSWEGVPKPCARAETDLEKEVRETVANAIEKEKIAKSLVPDAQDVMLRAYFVTPTPPGTSEAGKEALDVSEKATRMANMAKNALHAHRDAECIKRADDEKWYNWCPGVETNGW